MAFSLVLASIHARAAQVTAVVFNDVEVQRGYDTVTATITVLNNSPVPITCYVAGSTVRSGSSGWYSFSPTRQSLALAAGGSGSVQLTWVPTSGVSTGLYDFRCILYKTAGGSEFYAQDFRYGVFSVIDPLPGQVTGVTFDLVEVQRGFQTVTATVTLKNPSALTLDYYVAGASIRSGGVGWYAFSPSRQGLTLAPGASGSVQLTWAPGSGVSTGSYDFRCTVYKTAGGSQIYSESSYTNVFTVIDPLDGQVADVVFDPPEVQRGYQTLTATVTVLNSSAVTLSYYVAGAAIRTGGVGWYAFSPSRQGVTLAPGQSSSVQLTWVPTSGVSTGSYDFKCTLYRTAGGSEIIAEDYRAAAFSIIDPVEGQITDISFDDTLVQRGYQTLTATVTLLNCSIFNLTYYVAGATIRTGGVGWYYFVPDRQSITLAPGASGSVQLTWAPDSQTSTGSYDFRCTVYKTAGGSEIIAATTRASVYTLVDPLAAQITGVVCNPLEAYRGYHSVTSTVTVLNSSAVALTYYVGGAAIRTGGLGWYYFSPDRQSLTLAPGNSGSVALTWTPDSGVSTGSYDFRCTIYKTAGGSEIIAQDSRSAAFTVADPLVGQITSIVFDPPAVYRGYQTVTSTVTVLNPSTLTLSYYVAGASILSGGAGWHAFAPTRQGLTLAPGTSGSVQLTWTPDSQISAGAYDFRCTLYKTSGGSETYGSETRAKAFRVLDPFASLASLSVTLNPDPAIRAEGRWRVDGGAWQESGALVQQLSAGAHTLEFAPATDWIRPLPLSIELVDGWYASTSATYRLLQPAIRRDGTRVVVSWPLNDEGIALEETSALASAPSWTPVSGTTVVGDEEQHSTAAVAPGRFYRLRKP